MAIQTDFFPVEIRHLIRASEMLILQIFTLYAESPEPIYAL
jgi:hypothetical protein